MHTYLTPEKIEELKRTKATVLLVDSDIPCYSIGFMAKDDSSPKQVENSVDNFLLKLKRKLDATHYMCFLTDGKANFRNQFALTAKYKGNRDGLERPKWYPHIKDYLQDKWKAQLMVGIEADDALTIVGTYLQSHGIRVIICSLDKDLRQWPGEHYNWDSMRLDVVDDRKGDYNLWKQMITGDVATDNIPGLSDSAWEPEGPFRTPVFESYLKVPNEAKLTSKGVPSTRKYAHVRLVGWEDVTDLTYVRGLQEHYYGDAVAKEMLDNTKPSQWPSMVLKEYMDAYYPDGEVALMDDPAKYGELRFYEVFSLIYMLRTVEEIPDAVVDTVKIDFTPLVFQAKDYDDFAEDDTDADDPDFDF